MKRVIRKRNGINEKSATAIEELGRDMNRESRLAAIQALIPLGLKAVELELQAEIAGLAGARYSRGGDIKRWGSNQGSVFLGDQKVSITVPRVRNLVSKSEVPLLSYEKLQSPQVVDEMALSRVIYGLSQRNYEKAAIQIPETFGIKKTSTCRRFIRASAKKLKEFSERDLSEYDIVAIFMDGKFFAKNEIVIALGVTIEGEKVLLGFVETNTENHVVCRQFLNNLKDRGLNLDKEMLFVLDGGKGLHKGVKEVMSGRAVIQRCQWHKRENILRYLDKENEKLFRKKLQDAYSLPTHDRAKARLLALKRELRLINENAAASLEEGFEETLTLHRLGLFGKLGASFKTTNCIENVNHELARHTDRVDRWHHSNQRQRWVATAMTIIEPRLRKVKGHQFLQELRSAMSRHIVARKQVKEMSGLTVAS